MKLFLSLVLITISASTANAYDKMFNFGLITGLHYGETQHRTAPTESSFGGLTLGPAMYVDMGKVTLRGSFTYVNKEITVGEDDYFFSIFFDDQTNIEFSQFVLSVGAQFNFNRKFGLFGDLDYSLNNSDVTCYEFGSNSHNFSCADALADLKENVLHFKTGVSMRFVKWLRVEPYLSFSLNNYGKNQLEEAFYIGTNVGFAW